MISDLLQFTFPVAGISTYLFIPPMAAFGISFFTSMAGISGAFLLLPFQVSILGFSSPAVTATNMFYNVVGTPGGVARYARERRLVLPLVGSIVSGTLPGVLIGYYLRVRLMPDPRTFKLFVGIVLVYIGWHLIKDMANKSTGLFRVDGSSFEAATIQAGIRNVSFSFSGQRFCFSVPAIFAPALLVGVVSGIYGIGGGALIAPFLISVLRLPVYTIAGAVLGANFITSLAGVLFYSALPLHYGRANPPDWLLGALFGVGGIVGMYLGAKCQRFMPENTIKALLAGVVLVIAGKYIYQYF